MITFLKIEISKNKRRKFIYPLFMIVCLTLLWFYISMMKVTSSSPTTFKIDQSYLLMNFMVVNGVFSPLFLSVLASQISNIEFENRMWHILAVNNQSKRQLLNAKILYGLILVFSYWVIEVITAKLVGTWTHIIFKGHLFLITVVALGLALIVMFIFQLILSFFIKRQAIGMIIGVIGSFIALMTSGLLPDFILRWIPVDYIALASPLKMVHGTHIEINLHFLFNFVFIFGIGVVLIIISQILAHRRSDE